MRDMRRWFELAILWQSCGLAQALGGSFGVRPLVAAVQYPGGGSGGGGPFGPCNCRDPTVCMAGSFGCRAQCVCVPQLLCSGGGGRLGAAEAEKVGGELLQFVAKSGGGATKPTTTATAEQDGLPPLSRHQVPRSTLVLPRPVGQPPAGGGGLDELAAAQGFVRGVADGGGGALTLEESQRFLAALRSRAHESKAPIHPFHPAYLRRPGQRSGGGGRFGGFRSQRKTATQVPFQSQRTFSYRRPLQPNPTEILNDLLGTETSGVGPEHNHLGVYQPTTFILQSAEPRHLIAPAPTERRKTRQYPYPPAVPSTAWALAGESEIGSGGWVSRFRLCASCAKSRAPDSLCCRNGCCTKKKKSKA